MPNAKQNNEQNHKRLTLKVIFVILISNNILKYLFPKTLFSKNRRHIRYDLLPIKFPQRFISTDILSTDIFSKTFWQRRLFYIFSSTSFQRHLFIDAFDMVKFRRSSKFYAAGVEGAALEAAPNVYHALSMCTSCPPTKRTGNAETGKRITDRRVRTKAAIIQSVSLFLPALNVFLRCSRRLKST